LPTKTRAHRLVGAGDREFCSVAGGGCGLSLLLEVAGDSERKSADAETGAARSLSLLTEEAAAWLGAASRRFVTFDGVIHAAVVGQGSDPPMDGEGVPV
jgi:hypothetical protein